MELYTRTPDLCRNALGESIMMTLKILCRHLSGQLTPVCLAASRYLPIENIALLSPGQQADDPGTLYVGSGELLAQALEHWTGRESRMVLCTGDCAPLRSFFHHREFSCLTAQADAQQIANLLIHELFQFNRWAEEVRAGIYQRKPLHWIIGQMAKRIQCPLFWMNFSYQLISSDVNDSFEDKYIHELLTQGYLTSMSVDDLLHSSKKSSIDPAGHVWAHESVLDTGHYAVLCRVGEQQSFLGQFLVLENQNAPDDSLLDYVRVLSSFFWLYASLDGGKNCVSDGGYDELLIDLIEQKVKSEEELLYRQARLSPPMTPWYNLILVGFDMDHDNPYSKLIGQLHELMPEAVIVQYEKELVILDRRPKQARGIDSPEKLEKLMERSHAYACLGSGSQFLASFRSIYIREHLNLRFGMCIKEPQERRVFTGDEFHQYQIIDLCARQCNQLYDGNLLYLASYRYSALYRYDQQHQDNLCRILEVYIQNNCNTSQSAKALFLHRNTLINKIAKIEEIIGASLDDVSLRIELIFSARVMRYVKYYRREEPLQLKRKWTDNRLYPDSL